MLCHDCIYYVADPKHPGAGLCRLDVPALPQGFQAVDPDGSVCGHYVDRETGQPFVIDRPPSEIT